MYRGTHKHLRLFKCIGPMMWKFTGQAELIPNVEGLENILQDKDASVKSPMTSLSRVIKEKQMFSKVLLMLFGWKFLMMHWTNCHQAEKSVRKWLNQNSILSFQMLTGIHKQDTRSKSHRILLLLLIEVHLQRVMSMFYLYLLTITTQLLEQWALLTRVLPSIWFCVRYIWCSLR